ncbi:MAG: beta-ketoacyl synthase chain length factor [Betaproteobacteria bacterium]|nr:beta-ketoacyl synthase chain length factor [Betaproteobacteria bacterium]
MLGMIWNVPIADWAVWGEGFPPVATKGEQGAPDVRFVEPMLRRRLNPLAKMGLHVADQCAAGIGSVRLVYASRHGDLRCATQLLGDLAAGEPLSPTVFSMSVLNATAGLWSIIRRDHAPSTAISAAEETFGFALLEAALQCASHPAEPVLLIYADEPVPPVYGSYIAIRETAHAVALLLRSDAALVVECAATAAEGGAETLPQSLAFMHWLISAEAREATWPGPDRCWRWKRRND